jgi:hypothetical protein
LNNGRRNEQCNDEEQKKPSDEHARRPPWKEKFYRTCLNPWPCALSQASTIHPM